MQPAQPVRPKHLDLRVIHLPPSALVSILHRISGVLLALSIPLCIYGLQLSLQGPAGFERVRAWLGGTPGRWLVLVWAWALAHHGLAGIRHLLLDAGFGVDKAQARASAWWVLGGGGVWVLVLALLGLLS